MARPALSVGPSLYAQDLVIPAQIAALQQAAAETYPEGGASLALPGYFFAPGEIPFGVYLVEVSKCLIILGISCPLIQMLY